MNRQTVNMIGVVVVAPPSRLPADRSYRRKSVGAYPHETPPPPSHLGARLKDVATALVGATEIGFVDKPVPAHPI